MTAVNVAGISLPMVVLSLGLNGLHILTWFRHAVFRNVDDLVLDEQFQLRQPAWLSPIYAAKRKIGCCSKICRLHPGQGIHSSDADILPWFEGSFTV